MQASELSLEPFEQIAEDLYTKGISISTNAIPHKVLRALEARLNELDHDSFDVAGIGRQTDHATNATIRRDKIHWLDNNNELELSYLEHMGQLQQFVNRRLFMGLFSYESHFAKYQHGDFYKKHLDAFKGKTNRVLTTVLYLNNNWQPEFGGELVVYSPDNHDEELLRVTPAFGTFVTFLSDEFPHEVLPAQHTRFSIAGWFRVNASLNGDIDPPR